MKQFIKFCAPVVAVALTGIAAQAAQIVGTVNMGGNVTLNSMSLGSATAATGFDSVMAQGGIGSSYGNTQVPATMSPFTWSPALVITNPLWQFTVGGELFSFDLTSLTSVVVAPDNSQITLKGIGTVTGTGAVNYDSTTANWIFSIVDSAAGTDQDGATFSFGFTQSDTAINTTPDSGMTLTLLGGVLSGLALIKRKIA